MIRSALFAVLALTLAGLSFADDPKPEPEEPPVLLKKKKKDPPAEEKPAPKDKAKAKEDEPKDPADGTVDPKEVLERINKNIRESEERLSKKDPGDGTREVHRHIVKDLNSLIEQAKQPPPPSGGDPSAKSDNDSQQQTANSQRPRRGDRSRKDGSQDSKASKGNGNTGGNGNSDGNGNTRKPDPFKDRGPSLPEMPRTEIDAYQRDEYAARYTELLKQYYQTIAEKGRKEGK
jgi:hypothetical protein